MNLDTPLRKAAQRIVGTFGTTVTFNRVTGTSYNPATRTMTPTIATVMLKGRFRNYSDKELSSTILSGDRELTVAAADLGVLPVPVADTVTYGAITYDLANVTEELATDQAAIYILQLRR